MAATASVLMFGEQHQSIDIDAALRPSDQIGVGGAGFGYHVELTPWHPRPDQPIT